MLYQELNHNEILSVHPHALGKVFKEKLSLILYKNLYFYYLEETGNRNLILRANESYYSYYKEKDYYDDKEFEDNSYRLLEEYLLLYSLFYLINYSQILKHDLKRQSIVRKNIEYNYKFLSQKNHENFLYYYKKTSKETYQPLIDRIVEDRTSKANLNTIKKVIQEDKQSRFKFKYAVEITEAFESVQAFMNYMIAEGFDRYIWTTVRDLKVRKSHAAREGLEYNIYDSDIKPKQEANCRCWGTPISEGEDPPDLEEVEELRKKYFSHYFKESPRLYTINFLS